MNNGNHILMSNVWKGKTYTKPIHQKMNNLEKAIEAIKNKQLPTNTQAKSVKINIPTPKYVNPWEKRTEKLRTQIKTQRLAKNWTQRNLAAASGMSQGTITRAERNMWVSLSSVMRIADALGKELIIN